MCKRRKGGIIWHTQGSGQEHRHGAAGQVDPGEQPARPGGHHHRPRRTGQADRARVHRSGRDDHRTSSGRDLMRQLGQPKPRLLCSLVHKFGGRGEWMTSTPSSGTGSAAEPDRGRVVRVRRRMPPHPERQAAPGDEGDDAERGVHRLHRHAAAEAGQGRPAWRSSAATSTPTSSARRWKTAWCSTWCTRRATSTRSWAHRTRSTSGSRPRPRAERLAEGRAEEAMGHDAERAQFQGAHGPVVADIVFDFSVKPRCPASAATPSWWRPASTRPASTSRCSRRRRSKASARW
jgi:hypothetical protein